MDNRPFDRIIRGLEQARDYMAGNAAGCVVHRIEVQAPREGRSKI